MAAEAKKLGFFYLINTFVVAKNTITSYVMQYLTNINKRLYIKLFVYHYLLVPVK